jgi:hypothetical protein
MWTSLCKRSILSSIPRQLSLPVNFQHNLNLPEMAMKERHSTGLKVELPRDLGSLLEAFSLRGCSDLSGGIQTKASWRSHPI